jgi:histidyl-tRNA synthetase
MAKRNYIFDTIKRHFQLFGFEQIETPTMENRETLTGKYGEEGDRLIFNVLNSGDYLAKVEDANLTESVSNQLTPQISEKALRYDLTVPFARYVVQHQNEIAFPFKRFQIQPVWRADRPQRGRYREFYQCDADIIGSDSLLNEVELVKLFDEVLSELGLTDFSVKMNNRKVLSGIAEVIGKSEMIIPITVALDKLDKIGKEKVKAELTEKGLTAADLNAIEPLFEIKGDNKQVLSQLKSFLGNSKVGLEGIAELEEILSVLGQWSMKKAKVEIDVTLARGLNYYTGAIFEVSSNEAKMGSICGGGRYDDLTGIFGLPDMSGVGISFGADRIYDILEELDLFPTQLQIGTKLLFVNFGKKEEGYVLPLLQKLREKGVRAELYPEAAKIKKQMRYADQKEIPFVIMIGEEEMNSGQLSLKNMKTGEQEKVDFNQLIEIVS